MLSALISLLPISLLSVQAIITLILLKGDICPGQRGRLHKTLPIIAIAWLPVVMLNAITLLIPVLIAAFCTQVKTKKTRDSGPIWLIYLASFGAIILVISQMITIGSVLNILFYVLAGIGLGMTFAHALLVQARSRLQAFHRLLPIFGVLMAVLVVVIVSCFSVGFDDVSLNTVSSQLLGGFACLVTSIIIWCWHLLSQKKAQKLQVWIAAVLMLTAMTQLQWVMWLS